MPTLHAGLAIIGGGPMGAWLALEATRGLDPLRAPVVLFEAGDLADAGGPLLAFDAEGAVTHGADPALTPLLRDGAHALANLEPQTGRPIGHCRAGLVLVGEAAARADLGEPVDATWFEKRGLAHPGPGRYLEGGALVDPTRTHAEVLALARTRGAITRPGTQIEALLFEGDRVVGLETDRGTCCADRVVLTSHAAARALLPDDALLAAQLLPEPWTQHRHASRLVRAESGLSLDLPPGGLADISNDPMALEAFFASGDPLEAPHPAILDPTTGHLVAPNPSTGDLVLVAPDDPSTLQAQAPAHAPFEPPAVTTGRHHHTTDGRPLVGPHPTAKDLWLALSLGRPAPLLAPAIAPGLFAHLQDQPVAPYDPTHLTPARFR